MERKEVKIQAPEGYEIDKKNSTFECIKFKPIKKYITYEDICNSILKAGYYTNSYGEIVGSIIHAVNLRTGKNNATNTKQLERILALNQLLNIAEYYNTLHTINISNNTILYDYVNQIYVTATVSTTYSRGIEVIFNRKEDAQEVIDNPNFREILDMVYKN